MTDKINCLFLNCEQSHYYEVNFLDLIFPVFNSILLLPFGGSNGKASVYNMRDLGSIPGLRRFPGEGNGNPLHYFCLKKSHGWRSLVQATVHGVAKSQTWLSNFTSLHFTFAFESTGFGELHWVKSSSSCVGKVHSPGLSKYLHL